MVTYTIRDYENLDLLNPFDISQYDKYYNYRHTYAKPKILYDYANSKIERVTSYVDINEYNADRVSRVKNKKFVEYYLDTGKNPLLRLDKMRSKEYDGQIELRTYNQYRQVLSGDYLSWCCKKFKKPIVINDKARFMAILKASETSKFIFDLTKYKKNVYDSKRRAYQKVLDLAMSNNFDMFFTLTLSPKNMPSCSVWDVEQGKDYVNAWLKSIRRNEPNFAYILCADIGAEDGFKKNQLKGKKRYVKNLDNDIQLFKEADDSRRLHFHGLCTYSEYLGIKESVNARTGEVMIHNDRQVYNLTSWTFGYSNITYIDDKKAAASYTAKYVAKCGIKLGESENAPRYSCSRSLSVPKVHYIGYTDVRLRQFLEDSVNIYTKNYTSKGHIYNNVSFSDDVIVERLSNSIGNYYRKLNKKLKKSAKIGVKYLCVKDSFYA